MTTVAQLIAKLQTLDPNTEVQVGKEVTCGYATYMTHEPVDIEWLTVHDFTGEDWKTSPYAGKKILNLEAI